VSQYARGAAFERAVRHHLEDDGYDVIRSAGSKGAIDIVAMKPGELLFIQCKISGTVPPSERAEILRVAGLVGAIPVVAWKQPRKARPLLDRMTGPGPRDRVAYLTDRVA